MTTSTFQKTIAATLTIATLAIATSTTTASAGSKDFWKAAAVGAVAGVVTGAIIRDRRQPRQVVVVERQPRQPRQPVVIHTGTPVADGHEWSDRQHTNWCLNRFRSYNPRTDQYRSYNGHYKYCNSPYSG